LRLNACRRDQNGKSGEIIAIAHGLQPNIHAACGQYFNIDCKCQIETSNCSTIYESACCVGEVVHLIA
jgi:hypothetical protein